MLCGCIESNQSKKGSTQSKIPNIYYHISVKMEGPGGSFSDLIQPEKQEGKKRSKPLNLLRRLREHREDILRFMYNLILPFTNNLAERDVRMMKVQQKISGTFRSVEGAKIFCRIRGYTSTVRKNGKSVFGALKKLAEGNPFTVQCIMAEKIGTTVLKMGKQEKPIHCASDPRTTSTGWRDRRITSVETEPRNAFLSPVLP